MHAQAAMACRRRGSRTIHVHTPEGTVSLAATGSLPPEWFSWILHVFYFKEHDTPALFLADARALKLCISNSYAWITMSSISVVVVVVGRLQVGHVALVQVLCMPRTGYRPTDRPTFVGAGTFPGKL